MAQARADVELQIRSALAETMALADPVHVRERMKELRKRAGNPSQYDVAHDLKVPPRTFQSWENAEVETDRGNYDKVAKYYSRKLGQKVTANWILFGSEETPPLETPDLGAVLKGDTADISARLERLEATVAGLADVIQDLALRLPVTRAPEDQDAEPPEESAA